MNKSTLAACVAALSLAACHEPQSTAPVAARPLPTPAVLTPTLAARPANVDAGNFAAGEREVAPEPADAVGLAHEQPGVDHLARARTLRDAGDLKGAVTEARRAVYSSPADDEALTATARLASMAGQHRLAADAWARVAEVRTDDAMPRIQEARCRLRARDLLGAEVAARDAIARDGEHPEAHQALGRAALSRGELEVAIAAFEKVVALAPDHGHALNNLGLAYLRANENEKAVEVLARAAAVLPNVAWVQNNFGIALERTGRTEEAKSAYLTATSLSPKYVKARVNMNRVAKIAVPDDAPPPDDLEILSDMPSDH